MLPELYKCCSLSNMHILTLMSIFYNVRVFFLFIITYFPNLLHYLIIIYSSCFLNQIHPFITLLVLLCVYFHFLFDLPTTLFPLLPPFHIVSFNYKVPFFFVFLSCHLFKIRLFIPVPLISLCHSPSLSRTCGSRTLCSKLGVFPFLPFCVRYNQITYIYLPHFFFQFAFRIIIYC